MIIARYPMMLVPIRAFAMKHRSSIAALQQLFDDTTSALLANFRHKTIPLAIDLQEASLQ
jgi:hypothetical protein